MKKLKVFPFFILTLIMSLSSCAPVQDLELKELSSFKMVKGSGGMNFEVGLKVYNPNKMKISVLKYDLDIFVNGMELGKAVSDEKQFLKKKEEKEIKVQVSTSLMKLLSGGLGMLSGSLGGGNDMKVRVKGIVQGKAYGIKKVFKIDEKLPLNFNL